MRLGEETDRGIKALPVGMDAVRECFIYLWFALRLVRGRDQ
jgi:hypothetical protein